MKNFSPQLLAFLATTSAYNRADLFQITLKNGQVIRSTSSQYDITFGGAIYYGSHNGAWQRGKVTSEASFDLRANDMTLTVMAPATLQFPNSTISYMAAAQLGLFDAAFVQVYTMYWPLGQPPNPSLQVFGTVCQIDAASMVANGGASQYWSGNSPNDCFVQVTLGSLSVNGQIDLIYRNTVAHSSAVGEQYALSIIGPTGLPGTATIELGVNKPLTVDLVLLTGLTLSKGDVVAGACVGSTHYVLLNGIVVGSAVDSTFSAGGVATIGMNAGGDVVEDVQILDFQTGSAAAGPVLTTLFEDNFATDSLQDPLNPTNWLQDSNYTLGTAVFNVVLNANPINAETKFVGYIKPNGSISRSKIEFEVADALYLLNLPVPRHLVQAGCRHTLYDLDEFALYGTRTNCTIDPSGFTVTNAVAAGSTRQYINLASAVTADVYSQGYLTMTSGQNQGLTFYIKQQNSTTNVLLASAMPLPLAIGDTFTMAQGCDKSQATCSAKFSNLIHYGGQDYCPDPEQAI